MTCLSLPVTLNVTAILNNNLYFHSKHQFHALSLGGGDGQPDFAGFTVTMDAMSSDFITDFDTTVRNGSYVCGDGHCRIDMDAMSGDVYIRRAMSATAVAATEATTAAETV